MPPHRTAATGSLLPQQQPDEDLQQPRQGTLNQSHDPQPGARRKSTRPKHNHPAAVKALFDKWFCANFAHPFPDGSTKAELAARTGERVLPSFVLRPRICVPRRAEFKLLLFNLALQD